MYWNHRVIETKYTHIPDGSTETVRAIYEVYYNDDGSLMGYAETPAEVMMVVETDDEDSLEKQLQWFRNALTKPVLKAEDFDGVSMKDDDDTGG